MAAIAANQRQGGHLILEAGTGTGKTIAALVASLRSRGSDGNTILYTTRTNSQQAQVMVEHKALVEAGEEPGLLVPLMGRRHYCPLLRDDEAFAGGTPEELARACREAKRRARVEAETGQPQKGACPYYARLLRDGTGPVEALLRSGPGSADHFAAQVAGAGSCPYEALKELIPRADVVVLPYIFLIDEGLRGALGEWLGKGLDQTHVMVDEAHNLPEAARDHHSPRLTQVSLARAMKEAEEYKDPLLAGRIVTTSLLSALAATIDGLVARFVHNDEDGILPPDMFQETLLARLGLPSPALARITTDLEAWGQAIRDDRAAKGRLARSYLGRVGAFLRFWHDSQEAPYAHLVTGGENPALEAFLLEPASVLGWLRECGSTTHMSGTLAPLPEYRNRCGLPPSTTPLQVPTPYRREQLRIVGVKGLHRRWRLHQDDPELAARQQEAARALLVRLRGKTGIWFPSHQMLRDYLEEGFLHGVERTRFVEEAGMDQEALSRLIARFKAEPDPGALLVAVLGGRITEGIDFPGEALRNLLVMGIPYPKPTARQEALVRHDEARHGQGWAYAVHNPVGRVLRQAVGRLIRGPDDTGLAVFLDERVQRFATFLPGLEMVADAAAVLDGAPPGPGEFTSASHWPKREEHPVCDTNVT